MTNRTPVVLCEFHDGTWRFWCPFCRKYHTHGAAAGHRVAHCGNVRMTKGGKLVPHKSPFRESGYILKLSPSRQSG